MGSLLLHRQEIQASCKMTAIGGRRIYRRRMENEKGNLITHQNMSNA